MDGCRKEAFLQQWQHNFFDTRPGRNANPGRWEQCKAIDRYTAAKFIRHFVELFICNPNNKKAGEIACFLWVLICIAQEGEPDHGTIQKVLKLTSKDLDQDNSIINIGGDELEISWGLHQLLSCLCGKGEKKRTYHIFANIGRTGKTLERALHSASKELLPEKQRLSSLAHF